MTQRVDKDAMACNKPKRTPGHPEKSHIVKACYDGKEKIIRFGEQGASTAGKPKAGESERMTKKRASFKARHAKNIAKGPSSAAYWANRVKWAEGGPVELKEGGQPERKQAPLTAMQRILKEQYGLEPNIKRPGLVPLARNPRTGKIELTAPQFVYDAVRAFAAPGAILAGNDIDPQEEAQNFAVAFSPASAASKMARPAMGALRSMAVREAKPVARAMITPAARKANLDKFLEKSVMKTEAGEPVRVYHGTSDNITTNFSLHHPNRKDYGWMGRGAYVTDAPEMASMYASMKAGKEGPNVMPMYADIQNPYHMTLEQKNKLRFLDQGAIDDFTHQVQNAGHDATIVTYPDGTREIAVFNPERQLKSASGNRGTYDPEHPDLKWGEGGSVDLVEDGPVSYDNNRVEQLANQLREEIYG